MSTGDGDKRHMSHDEGGSKSESFIRRWNMKFANIKVYALIVTFSNNSHGMFWFAITGILTSIERRYSFDSATLGRLLMAADIGPLAFVLFIAHFANRTNMARLLAVLYIVASLAVGMMTLPHFVLKSGTNEEANSSAPTAPVCDLSNETQSQAPVADDVSARLEANNAAYGIMYAALFIAGTFLSPGYTLQFSYLESNTKKSQTVFFIAMTGVGFCAAPIIGMFLSAWATSIYVDLSDPPLSPEDPAWVGAWWLALLIIAACMFVWAPLFCCFPRKLKHAAKELSPAAIAALKPKSRKQSEAKDIKPGDIKALEQEARRKVYSMKGFFLSMKRLLTNPAYLFLIFGYVFWAFSGWGSMSFFPKYYQVVFNMTAWQASITTGLVTGISMAIGRLVSGVATRYFKLSLRRNYVICLMLTMTVVIFTVLLLFLGCENQDLHGRPPPDGGYFIEDTVCANGCSCSNLPYTPVCDSGVTYFSPCHAGCMGSNITLETDKILYTACNCTQSRTALHGVCDTGCDMFIPYTAAMLIGLSALAFTSPFLIVFTMRCVDPADKTLAYGLGMFVLGIAGWIPAPTLYGVVIDTTCTVWEDIGGGITGSCWEYDIVALRYRLQGLTAALRFGQFACYALVYIIGRNKFEFWEQRCSDEEDNDEKKIDAKIGTDPKDADDGVYGIKYVTVMDEHVWNTNSHNAKC